MVQRLSSVYLVGCLPTLRLPVREVLYLFLKLNSSVVIVNSESLCPKSQEFTKSLYSIEDVSEPLSVYIGVHSISIQDEVEIKNTVKAFTNYFSQEITNTVSTLSQLHTIHASRLQDRNSPSTSGQLTRGALSGQLNIKPTISAHGQNVIDKFLFFNIVSHSLILHHLSLTEQLL
ncbi:jg7051 [Pararge aegeria aegeria]|uniref:Jg7051 protein n=1 Tax=Pararge aegeria aegeria TaxID=348720 RepID=A0A8S4RGZ0_9NEOP|nr:jg7051 [Pararge aegeria aegeria]